ncbi:hypothetical protein Q1695_006021 [Nippostrongylus brasiliensis]|nr:hypothetical protein Q1695_006021 [Nippostrongylus brasiliensis]
MTITQPAPPGRRGGLRLRPSPPPVTTTLCILCALLLRLRWWSISVGDKRQGSRSKGESDETGRRRERTGDLENRQQPTGRANSHIRLQKKMVVQLRSGPSKNPKAS